MRNAQQHRPSHQGRPLPRPDDEVVDQGLAFDVGTLMGRRKMLRTIGLGAAALGLAACGGGSVTGAASTATVSGSGTGATASVATSVASQEIPDETAGPYPGDGSNGPDVLEQSGIVRSDLRSSFGESSGTAAGIPMTLALSITGWPHIHFEIYPDQASITDVSTVIATSQVALPWDACDAAYAVAGYEASVQNLAQVSLDSDNVFGDDGGASQLGTVTGDPTNGYTVSLAVGVDTATTPTGGGGSGGGGSRGGGGGAPGGAPLTGARPGG